jgi:hypothetical protein
VGNYRSGPESSPNSHQTPGYNRTIIFVVFTRSTSTFPKPIASPAALTVETSLERFAWFEGVTSLSARARPFVHRSILGPPAGPRYCKNDTSTRTRGITLTSGYNAARYPRSGPDLSLSKCSFSSLSLTRSRYPRSPRQASWSSATRRSSPSSCRSTAKTTTSTLSRTWTSSASSSRRTWLRS